MNRTEARKRAKELVAKMTVEEKASQLRYDAPAIERLVFRLTIGGMRRFTALQEPAQQQCSRRLLVLLQHSTRR